MSSLSNVLPLQGVEDSTAVWEEKSKLCERDQLIKKIAIAAIAVLGVALGVGLFTGVFLARVLAPVGMLTVLFSVLFAAFASESCDWTKYSDKKVAQRVVDCIKTVDLEKFVELSKKHYFFDGVRPDTKFEIDNLERYGFINKDKARKMHKFANEWKENETLIIREKRENKVLIDLRKKGQTQGQIIASLVEYDKAIEARKKLKEEWVEFRKELTA